MLYQSRWAPSQNAFKESSSSSSAFSSHDKQRTVHSHSPSTGASVQLASGCQWSDPALKLIDEVANSMEVDSQVSSGTSSTFPGAQISLVLDTNVLLSSLDVIQQFAEDIEKAEESIFIVIPGIVVQELDYQKTDSSHALCWSARMASTWILSKLKERKHIKGQAYQETLQRSGSWKRRDTDTSNDDLIVDCCLFLREKNTQNVFAISDDKNFCNNAEFQGILTINPRDHARWSSRSLARWLFGDNYLKLFGFAEYKEKFRPKGVSQALQNDLGVQPVRTSMDNDGMEIDDEPGSTLNPPPQHLLDDLHDQVLAHFTILLSELLHRVSPTLFAEAASKFGTASSVYASSYTSKPARKWGASDILVHLCNERRLPRSAPPEDLRAITAGSSRMSDFFTAKYSPRGRSGQHWSRADWTSCLGTLGAVARVYEDDAILNSLTQLSPQIALVFQTPMRPTGTGGFG